MERVPTNGNESKIKELTPRQIVEELDKYIIGQEEAKKAVAIALRNRARRKYLSPDLREEVTPKNILMIGPTGVGKTEIARRLANLVGAPFIKVEATKFTEIGYVGRNVDSIIKDLLNAAINMVKKEEMEKVKEKVSKKVDEMILRKIKEKKLKKERTSIWDTGFLEITREEMEELWRRYKAGEFEEEEIEIEIETDAFPSPNIVVPPGMEDMQDAIREALAPFTPKVKKKKIVKVKEAKRLLLEKEIEKYIDMEYVIEEAKRRTEELGIVFIDEIDKIAIKEHSYGPDVSREGVQRDLLPIVEGTVVHTRYGPIRTDYILFIAAGAFHIAKPSDLIPELQGRFPIRVELKPLSKEDLRRILVEPKNSLVRQYKALLATEGIELEFTDDALDRIAEIAYNINNTMENIGARRLYTIMEKVLEELSFNAPDIAPQKVVITKEYVDQRLKDIIQNEDITKYIL